MDSFFNEGFINNDDADNADNQKMSPEAVNVFHAYQNQKLTKEQIMDGWHWCPEWDYLLIRPGTPEMECCSCKLDQ